MTPIKAAEQANATASDNLLKALQPAIDSISQAAEMIAKAHAAPRRIVRDPKTGRAVGIVCDMGEGK